MKVDLETAEALKLAVEYLNTTPHGQTLIEYLNDKAGYFAPAYDPSSQTQINLAAGRGEMMQILRNLERLEAEQIVELCQEGQ